MSYKESDNRPINYLLNPLEQFVPNWRDSPSEILQNQQLVSKYEFKKIYDNRENVYRQNLIFTPCLRFSKIKYEKPMDSKIVLQI